MNFDITPVMQKLYSNNFVAKILEELKNVKKLSLLVFFYSQPKKSQLFPCKSYGDIDLEFEHTERSVIP